MHRLCVVWILASLACACTPDYEPLVARSCQLNLDCASQRCVKGYCALEPNMGICTEVGEVCDPALSHDPSFQCLDDALSGEGLCASVCQRSEDGADCPEGQFCEARPEDPLLGVCRLSP